MSDYTFLQQLSNFLWQLLIYVAGGYILKKIIEVK